MQEQELNERLALIESMMLEGRKTTEYWGWSMVLWGISYLVAIAWASLLPAAGGRALAWPVTMVVAAVLTTVIARGRMRGKPTTDRGRGIHAMWLAVGCGIFVFAFPTAYSGHWEPHIFMAAIEVLLGVANVGSGIMLRWPVQITVGGLWWASAIASCFVPERAWGWSSWQPRWCA